MTCFSSLPHGNTLFEAFSVFKNDLAEITVEKISPISLEINKLKKDTKYLDEIIESGKIRATEVADSVLSKVYEIIGFQKP